MSGQIRPVYLGARGCGAPYIARALVFHETGWYRRMDFTSIFVITRGEGEMRIRRPRTPPEPPLRLEPGRMFLGRPEDVSAIAGRGPDGVSISWVSFPTSEWRMFSHLAGYDTRWAADPTPPTALIDIDGPGFRGSFAQVLERSGTASSHLTLLRFWIDFAPLLIRTPDEVPRRVPTWLDASLAAMRTEENLRAGVPRLAQLADVTPAHLALTTRRYYQATPTALVTELRLRHAAHLLKTTARPVGEIASRSGFTSLAYFSNRFHAIFGVAPRDYRALDEREAGPALQWDVAG